MTHSANKSSDQRGALMMEAIALLGLMTMMSPMVVRQSSERITEMEDVTVAAQMKNLKDALANYMEAKYSDLIPANTTAEKTGVITPANLRPYLPASYFDGANLRGNKLLDSDQIKFGYRANCSEVTTILYEDNGEIKSKPCKNPNADTGLYTDLTNSCKCERYKLTGVVVGGRETAIPDKRASRIASMIGADGGYVRSDEIATAMGLPDNEKRNLIGSQGMWEASPASFGLGDTEVPSHGGMIVASTAYSAGRSADYLYRKKVSGIPDANSMFTDLDMGGNGACDATSGDGRCSRINNAGGVEVIAGKLIVREKHTTPGTNQADGAVGNTYARISLGTDVARMNVSKGVVIRASDSLSAMDAADNTVKIDSKSKIISTTTEMESTATAKITLTAGSTDANKATLTMANNQTIKMGTGASSIDMSNTDINATGGTNVSVTATTGDVSVKGKKYVKIDAETNNIELHANSDIKQTAGNDIVLDATGDIAAGATNITMDATSEAEFTAMGEDNIIKMSGAILIRNKKSDADIQIAANRDAKMYAKRTVYLGAGGSIGEDNNPANQVSVLALNAKGGDNSGTAVDASDNILGTERKGGTLAQMKGGLFLNSDIAAGSGEGLFGGLQIGKGGTNDGISGGTSTVYLTDRGMAIHRSTAKQPGFLSGEGAIGPEDVVITAKNNNGGGIIAVNAAGANNGTAGTPSVKLIGETGVIEASRMVVETVRDSGESDEKKKQKNAVRNLTQISYTDKGIKDTVSRFNVTENGAKTFTQYSGGSTTIRYNEHNDGATSFKIDPAFVSVMNDIRVTSRGGARLSEILPNYITKGIYELHNTYTKGPWPCGNGTTGNPSCVYDMETTINNEDVSMLTCADMGLASSNQCSLSNGKIHIDLTDGNYVENPNGGLAHPFMGVVPAPGREVSSASLESSGEAEKMAAYDEGICPDGYTALIAITPAAFSVGGVWDTIAEWNVDDNDIFVAEGDVNATANGSGILQGGNQLGVTNKPIEVNNKTVGWAIAISTLAYGSNSSGNLIAYWNHNATVYVDSITAYVTTYCYYNPGNFYLPNMKVRGQGILTPAENVTEITVNQDPPSW